MTMLKPASPLGKGQMRCFQCKQPCAIRDGHWRELESQQVFLCHSCELKQSKDQASKLLKLGK